MNDASMSEKVATDHHMPCCIEHLPNTPHQVGQQQCMASYINSDVLLELPHQIGQQQCMASYINSDVPLELPHQVGQQQCMASYINSDVPLEPPQSRHRWRLRDIRNYNKHSLMKTQINRRSDATPTLAVQRATQLIISILHKID